MGSPPGEPELVAEVGSSLEVHQGWEQEGSMPQMTGKPRSTDV